MLYNGFLHVLLNEGVQVFFHDIYHYFVCIADCIKLYKDCIKGLYKRFPIY